MEPVKSNQITNMMGGFATKSGMNPCIVLALVGLIIILAAIPVTGFLQIGLFTIGALPIAAACFLLLWFGIKAPYILQSEEFRLKEKAIAIYGDGKRTPEQLATILSARPEAPQTKRLSENKDD